MKEWKKKFNKYAIFFYLNFHMIIDPLQHCIQLISPVCDLKE